MALIHNKFCHACGTTASHTEGYDEKSIFHSTCSNCAKIENENKQKEIEKEKRKELRDGIFARTKRKTRPE